MPSGSFFSKLFATPSSSRKSPQGYDEYIYPEGSLGIPGGGGAAGRTIYGLGLPYAEYDERFANNPVVTTHERLHIGQYRLENRPGMDDIKKVFTNYHPPVFSPGNPDMEMPAYAFESIKKAPVRGPEKLSPTEEAWVSNLESAPIRQQEAYNNYINLLYRLNPGKSYHVEAAAPEQLERQYIKTTPRPIVTPIEHMKKVPIFGK